MDWGTDQLGWWNDPVPYEQMPALPGERTNLPISCGNFDNTSCVTTVEYHIGNDERCETAETLAAFFVLEGAAESDIDELAETCSFDNFEWEDGTITWQLTTVEHPTGGQPRVRIDATMGPGR